MSSTSLSARKGKVPEAWCSGTPVEAVLVHRCPVEQHLVAGVLHQFHFLRYAPCQGLLMQRDIGEILQRNLERLLDKQIAFGGVRFDQYFGGKFIELLVAVTGEIGLAA